VQAADRISAPALEAIREAISEAGGDEVVFVGYTDADLIVERVEVVAQGSLDMAPAPRELLERGQVVIHNHPNGVLRPSREDVTSAAGLGDAGIGSYIVDNEAEKLTVVCEPLPPREIEPLDPDALAALVDADGALSRLLPSFESRSSQVEMLRSVAGAFNDSRVLAVEAGTGIGKSFAYLVPALDWASRNDERVVVSTATINLQQQLVDKDIPTVLKLLGKDVPVALVKGRGNYLCLKRLREALDESTLFEEPEDELTAVREWAAVTASGSRSDAPSYVADEIWSRVNSDADSCNDLTCRLREDCFFVRARREAAAARVLVANHHLLFIDLALRVRGIGYDTRAILPPFGRIIFDEAHSIENSATSLFSDSFSLLAVRKHTRRLRRERRGRAAGLLPLARASGADPEIVARAVAAAAGAESAASDLNAATVGTWQDPAVRMVPGDTAVAGIIGGPVAELHTRLVQLSATLADLVSDKEEKEGPIADLRVVARRVDRLAGIARSFLEFDQDPDRVFWIEFTRRADGSRIARFVSTPLDVGSIMREAVFDPFETVVFTSATLTVADRFDYWSSRVGLADAARDSELLILSSPFPYREHALLAVPSDAPLPSDPAYMEFLPAFLGDLLEISEGHALVLFTSFQMLRAAHELVAPRLLERGIRCLRQGDDDRARLLARFTEDVSSVLFATESFWQGVDAPGDALQVVVLCRLPFRVPTDPVLTARMEAIEARGGNAFADLALPEAVMRLRQGFGRLIRRTTDRGVVVVTDVRMVTKHYGELFVRSLPETQRSFSPAANLLEDVERFLYS
jgi:ATP-dependent DNA helicase DinG